MTDLLEAPLCLPPRPLRNRAGLSLPAGTCDTHFHVFPEGTPLASPRSYTPTTQPLEGWLALARSFGIDRGVLVQPSVYGTDNSALLGTLATHPERLRGIVVIPPGTSDDALVRMDALGVRGIRINLRNKSGIGFDALADLAPRIRRLGWHVVFQVGPDTIATVADLTARHHIVGIIDHLAFMPLDEPGTAYEDLHRALDTGRIYVKISAPYRLRDHADHVGYRKLLSMLAVRYPNRLLWGTDWPHTELFESVPEDDDLVALSLSALPPESHESIFVKNPETLYFRPAGDA